MELWVIKLIDGTNESKPHPTNNLKLIGRKWIKLPTMQNNLGEN